MSVFDTITDWLGGDEQGNCTSATGIPIPGLDFTVSIETLATGLSLVTALVYYSKWKEDKDNISDLADRYVGIGVEYCAAATTLRQHTSEYYTYVNSAPAYQPTGAPSKRMRFGRVSPVVEALREAEWGLPADASGDRCRTRAAADSLIVRQGTAAWVDGTRYERALMDKYLASRLQALTTSVSGLETNLGSAFALVGDTIGKQAEANSIGLNSSLYMLGRGLGFNKINQEPRL